MGGPRPKAPGWADGWAAPFVLALVTAAVFARSLPGAFVWDDHRFIDENPSVLRPQSWLRFLTDPTTVDTLGARGIVRPLRTIEFALDHAIWGLSPVAFRIHSLLWHVAAAVLLLLVLRRLLPDARAAFVAAAFWAVHPVHAESVAFVSSRGDVAMGACAFASVLFALRSAGIDRNLAISLVFAALCPLYKEAGVALFIVIAVMRWTKLTRVPVWPYVLVAAAYLGYRAAVQVGPIDHGAAFVLGGSTEGTFATMMRGFGYYIVQMLLPAQSLDWHMVPSTSFEEPGVMVCLALHAVLVIGAIRLRRTAPLVTLAVGWFYAFLLPVANWPVFLSIATNERFLYLPAAGFALGVGVVVAGASARLRIAATAVVVGLAASTFVRLPMWLGDDVLWETVRADHDSPRAIDRFARRRRLDALPLRDAAFRLPPGPERDAALANAKSLFEESLGAAHAAINHWIAIELSGRPQSYLMRDPETTAASDCYILGRDAEALFHADEAIRIGRGEDRFGHFNRAMPLLKLGFAPQAIASMQRAVQLGYAMPDAEIGGFFQRAAAACERDGLLAVAQTGYEAALRALPDGDARSVALSKLDALRGRPLSADAAAREQRLLAELDEKLRSLPLSCPARRAAPVRR